MSREIVARGALLWEKRREIGKTSSFYLETPVYTLLLQEIPNWFLEDFSYFEQSLFRW